MRIGYSEDEDYPGQFELWQANCRRSLRGKQGQKELRELRAALLALPEKKLLRGELYDDHGGVCAIGAYAKHKGLKLSAFPADEDTDRVGVQGGMPPLVAWKVVEVNDMILERRLTPEERYTRMLAWVEGKIGQSK